MTFTGPNIVQRLVNLLQTPLRPKVHVIHPDTAIGFLLDVLKSRKASRVVSDRPATGNRRVGRLVTNFIWWRTSRVGGQHRSWTRWERPKRAEHPFRRVGHPNAGTPTRVSAHSNSRRSMQPTARRTSSSSQRSARPMRLTGTEKGSIITPIQHPCRPTGRWDGAKHGASVALSAMPRWRRWRIGHHVDRGNFFGLLCLETL
jgi:hypothetical protein